jgi:hypothetical protein
MGCQKSCALRREANLTGFERAEKALLGGSGWELNPPHRLLGGAQDLKSWRAPALNRSQEAQKTLASLCADFKAGKVKANRKEGF